MHCNPLKPKPFPFISAMIKNSILILFVFSLILSGCGGSGELKKEFMTIDHSFAPYVASYTSGVIRKNDEIRIKLQQTPESFEQDVLSLLPHVDGFLSLADDKRTLIFKPENSLKNGQIYQLGLDLGELIPNLDNDLKHFEYQIKVIDQDFSVEFTGLESNTDQSLTSYNFKGVVYTADEIENDKLKDLVSSKNGDVNWLSDGQGLKHEFTIENIDRKSADYNLKIEVNGDAIDVDKNWDQEFEIPAQGKFKVLMVSNSFRNENYVSVTLSDPLANQDLKGLVRFKDEIPAIRQIEVESNRLIIYTDEGLNGDFELILDQGIKNSNDINLPDEYRKVIKFENNEPEITLLGTGNIIPKSNQLLFPFEVSGLRGVNVKIYKIYEDNVLQFFQENEIDGNYNLQQVAAPVFNKDIIFNEHGNVNLNHKNKFSLDLTAFIEPEPGAIYKVQLNMPSHLSNMPCLASTNSQTTNLVSETNEDWSIFDSEEYYSDYFYPEDYDWQKRNDPCDNSYYTVSRSVVRNVMASNFGIITKITGEKELDVSISNLINTNPMGGVNVKVYNQQRRLIGDGETDSNGFLKMDLKERPFMLVASKDKEKGYLKIADGNSINMSRFDIDGTISRDGLKGFIYGERGVWRPGDSIFVTCVLQNNLKKIPNNYPLKLSFYSPDNQLYDQLVSNNGENGFYTFKLKTPEDAKTGRWYVKATAGNFEFFQNIKVETIKPNKLKIKLAFKDNLLAGESTQASLKVNWLNGSKASDLKANVTATFIPQKTSFSKYPNFNFDDITKNFSTEELIVFDGKTDSEGNAIFGLKTKLASLPSGQLRVGLFTKVFEKGGDFSTNYMSKEYSPYSSFVGLQVNYSSKDWEMLETGKNHKLSIVSLDNTGNPILKKELKATLYRMKNRWWYSNDGEEVEFMSSQYSTLISTKNISTTNGKASYDIKVDKEDWGKYFLRIEDPESGHSVSQMLWIDWPDWRSRGGMGDDASILSFKTDKEKYNVGETAEIAIPSQSGGKALLTIENGSRILEKRWIKTEDGQTKIKIKIGPEMSPNVYAAITLIQAHEKTANDLPIRMFGITPIIVNNPSSHLEPIITSPTSVEPEKEFTIEVKEKEGKAMTYTLAIVDEGLLDITNFGTPDIWKVFNQKEALGVKTWDLYSSVLGAFNGKFANIFAIGGGDEGIKALDKGKVNRFKPVVQYLGPYTISQRESKKHKITIPNYLGSVKVMVVAGNQQNQFGSGDKAIAVKKPLMLTTTMPRVLSPGETVNVPVTIFAEPNITKATLTFTSNDILEVGQKVYQINLNKGTETIVNIPLKVKNELGIGSIKALVKSGSYSSYEEINVPVRLPNALETRKTDVVLKANDAKSFSFEPFGLNGSSNIELQVSSSPPINLAKRLNYLISYPYGCLEQTSSSALGQLFLSDLIELSAKEQKEVQENVNQAISRIKTFQLNNGGLGYWPNSKIASDWASTYAGHFMLEAEKKGYALPIGFKSNWIKYQTTRANQWNATATEKYVRIDDHQLAQAYRLYTLALSGKSNLGAMNRLRNVKNLDGQAAFRLAAAYALIGKSSIAKELMNTKEQAQKGYYNSYTYGSVERDLAMKLETYSLLKEDQLATNVLKLLATRLNSNSWLSTQSTAYSLMSVAKYLGEKPSGKLSFDYTLDGKKQAFNLSKTTSTAIKLPLKKSSISIKNTSGAPLFVTVVNQGIPKSGTEKAFQNNLQMRVQYKDLNNNPIDITNLAQGTDFKAEVTLTNPNTLGDYTNLALNQIFPSGWEVINLRVNDQSSKHTKDVATYQDIKDDRVYTFFDLKRNQSKTFVVLLNATYKGKFSLPAVQCKAMYNNDIKAVSMGGQVEVN
ncbi:hypothetical protein SAMN06298216_0102 [Spirosomataceae bacterium TFI 002]|nr:hypothetical protein SAMN06298216_0102 [Spirosomataceae bacterium TFI 002]